MIKKSELIRTSQETEDQWEPAGLLEDLEGLDRENFVYRWCTKDPGRHKKLTAEHWVLANELEGDKVTHRQSVVGKQEGNVTPDGTTNYRELVLYKLPMKWAEARRRYHRQKRDKAMEIINNEVSKSSSGAIRPTFISEHGGEKVTVID
jgi:hypothetical protein